MRQVNKKIGYYKDKGIEAQTFDILVANPPYSVSGFKQHLKLRNNTFRILDVVTNDDKEIETLFVERISQLLRPQGLAAVVLPASILSNSSNSNMAAREELMQNFYIRAIVSFGSKTFGATGTNTVTLFLERYNEPPRIAELTKDSVDAIMNGNDITDFTDRQLLAEYLQHQKIQEEEYLRSKWLFAKSVFRMLRVSGGTLSIKGAIVVDSASSFLPTANPTLSHRRQSPNELVQVRRLQA